MHAGRGLYRTFSGLSAPASESTTERPDVSLPIERFVYSITVTTDKFIYNEIDRFNFPTVL